MGARVATGVTKGLVVVGTARDEMAPAAAWATVHQNDDIDPPVGLRNRNRYGIEIEEVSSAEDSTTDRIRTKEE